MPIRTAAADNYDSHPEGPQGEHTPLCWATHDFPFGIERHPITGARLDTADWQRIQERTMQAMLDAGASLLNAEGPGTALHCAAFASGTPATVRFLVTAATRAGIGAATFLNRGRNPGRDEVTALCWAADTPDNATTDGRSVPANALAQVRTMLALGANPNGNGPRISDDGELEPDGDHPLRCAEHGRESHAEHPDVGLYDTMIEELLAAGAVWPEGYEP